GGDNLQGGRTRSARRVPGRPATGAAIQRGREGHQGGAGMSTFDPKSVRLIASIKTPGILFGIALDEDRRTLYGAGMDGALYSLDLSNPRAVAVQKGALHENYISSLVLRGDVLISTGYDRKLVWSEAGTGKVIRSVRAHDGWIRKLAMTPDRLRFAT